MRSICSVPGIYAAWLRHIVLIFPGQKLTPEQLIAFAGRFGPLDDHREDPVSRLDGYPEIFSYWQPHGQWEAVENQGYRPAVALGSFGTRPDRP